MKGNVPRAGTGARGYEGRIVRRQFPARRVETKHEDPIEPFVGHHDEPAARIEDGVVWMRAGLLFAIWPRFARESYKIATRPQGSVLLDRHHADRAGAVIGGYDPAPGRIDRQVHRVLTAAGLPVERCDAPILLIDRIGADIIEIGMHGIEEALRPV